MAEPHHHDGSDGGGRGDRYRYDPADPTPSVGGPVLLEREPVVDNRALEAREDVLTYTTPPLSSRYEAIGPVSVELWVSASEPNFDVFARVCDVDLDAVSRNVCDALVRLVPERFEQTADGSWRVAFELWPTGHRFAAGHRIRLQVPPAHILATPAIRARARARSPRPRCGRSRSRFFATPSTRRCWCSRALRIAPPPSRTRLVAGSRAAGAGRRPALQSGRSPPAEGGRASRSKGDEIHRGFGRRHGQPAPLEAPCASRPPQDRLTRRDVPCRTWKSSASRETPNPPKDKHRGRAYP